MVYNRFSPFFCCSPFHITLDFICERFFYFSSSFCLRFIADSSCGSNECFNALWSKYSSYASTIQQKFTNFMEQNERRRDKKISNYVNMNQTKRRINHTSTQAHIHGAHWSKVQTKPTRTFSLSFRWPYRAILYSVSILYELRLCRAFFFT